MKKTEATKATTALAVANPSVSDAIQVINDQLKQMKHVTDSTYVSPCKISTVNGMIDIKTETSVEKLMTAYATVKMRVEAIENAYTEFGIDSYSVIKIDGGTLTEWKKDINLRLQVIQYKDKVDELTAIKKEWEELMDKEDRKALLLKKMQSKGILEA